MYLADVHLRVRRAVMVEEMSIREASRVFGLHQATMRKMLAYSIPPGHWRKRPGSEESRYCPPSRSFPPKRFNNIAREHWGIENRPHWALDEAFKDGQSRNRGDSGQENPSGLRKQAPNLGRLEPFLNQSQGEKRRNMG